MLIPIVALLSMQVAAVVAPIGVAAALPDGQICVAMPAPALVPGVPLTLVEPAGGGTAVVVKVMRPVPACERLERAMISGPYYLVESPAPGANPPTLWVALAASVPARRNASGALVVRAGPAYAEAQVRSCTSREGLHLTVWSGVPLTSQRLWHQYYYLGYDTEPSCDERDVRTAD